MLPTCAKDVSKELKKIISKNVNKKTKGNDFFKFKPGRRRTITASIQKQLPRIEPDLTGGVSDLVPYSYRSKWTEAKEAIKRRDLAAGDSATCVCDTTQNPIASKKCARVGTSEYKQGCKRWSNSQCEHVDYGGAWGCKRPSVVNGKKICYTNQLCFSGSMGSYDSRVCNTGGQTYGSYDNFNKAKKGCEATYGAGRCSHRQCWNSYWYRSGSQSCDSGSSDRTVHIGTKQWVYGNAWNVPSSHQYYDWIGISGHMYDRTKNNPDGTGGNYKGEIVPNNYLFLRNRITHTTIDVNTGNFELDPCSSFLTYQNCPTVPSATCDTFTPTLQTRNPRWTQHSKQRGYGENYGSRRRRRRRSRRRYNGNTHELLRNGRDIYTDPNTGCLWRQQRDGSWLGANPNSNPGSCGTSGATCTSLTCNSGYHNFNGVVTDGCEFAASSIAVVGATCTAASSTTTCSGISACNSGLYNYDGIASNGCEGKTCLSTDGKIFVYLLSFFNFTSLTILLF